MTATPASLVPIADVLEAEHGIGLDRLEPLTGGYQNEVYRAGDMVVRVERASAESVAWEHALVRFFSEQLPEIEPPFGAPIAADASVVSLWPYVEGRPARRRHEPHALAAAELLSRLHRAGVDWPGGQRPGARALHSEGAQGPIHGDFYRGNVLMRRGRIVGLVDWEESHVDAFDYELASAVWEFCSSKRAHDFDRRLAATMLDACGSDLTPGDLVPLILTRLRYELEAWSADSDEPYRRHLRHSIARLGG